MTAAARKNTHLHEENYLTVPYAIFRYGDTEPHSEPLPPFEE